MGPAGSSGKSFCPWFMAWPPWALPFGGTSRAPAAGQAGAEGPLESEARRESGVNRSPTSAGCNAQSSGALHDSFEGAPSILLPGEAGTLTGNLT